MRMSSPCAKNAMISQEDAELQRRREGKEREGGAYHYEDWDIVEEDEEAQPHANQLWGSKVGDLVHDALLLLLSLVLLRPSCT